MNYQNFNQAGGFPIETQTLAQMQSSYQALQVFGELAGNFSILQGCQENNGTIANGIVYLDGEVLELVGGPKQDTVFVTESVQKQEFKNGKNNPVVYNRKLTFGLGENPYNWADFKRPKTTIQLTEQKAEQSIISALVERIVALENKLTTVETGAQKNVQPNWQQDNDTKNDYIKNKPAVFSILTKGSVLIGDIEATDVLKSVMFDSVLPTDNYMVMLSVVSKQPAAVVNGNYQEGWNLDNDISYVVVNKTASGFQIGFREYNPQFQKLQIDYLVIPL